MDPVAGASFAVLLLVVGATGTFWWRVAHRGGIALSALTFGCGLVTAGLAAGHLVGVAITELRRTPPQYDFRVYALVLLGAVLVALGTSLAITAIGVARGEYAAWRNGVTAAVVLLIVTLPLAPLQGFAVALSFFAFIGLASLLAVSRRITMTQVKTSIPPNTPTPIGPYSHIAKVGEFITIGGTAGVNPATGQLAGPDAYLQAKQILASFKVMLESVDSNLDHVIHINVFLLRIADFEEMNRAYVEMMGDHRPARTVIGVNELPKAGAVLTMNLTATTRK